MSIFPFQKVQLQIPILLEKQNKHQTNAAKRAEMKLHTLRFCGRAVARPVHRGGPASPARIKTTPLHGSRIRVFIQCVNASTVVILGRSCVMAGMRGPAGLCPGPCTLSLCGCIPPDFTPTADQGAPSSHHHHHHRQHQRQKQVQLATNFRRKPHRYSCP